MNTKDSPERDIFVRWLLVLAVIGLALYFSLAGRVFPNASLCLSKSRPQIMEIAREIAGRARYEIGPKNKSIESITFTTFDEAKTFLEFDLGLAKAVALMREKVPVWAWSVRFCQEYSLEECRVLVAPDGKLVGFTHLFEDEKAMPSLSHEVARGYAKEFLQKYVGLDPSELKLVTDDTNARVKRVDHSFVFEDEREEFNGAHMRYGLKFSGDVLSTYTHYLFVPDSWRRKYEGLRYYNELLQSIAGIFYSTMQFIAVLVVPWAVSRKEMRWRFALFGGLAMGLASIFDTANNYSSVLADYQTTTSLHDYLLQCYGRAGASIIGSVISGIFLFGGADVIYRLFYPKRIALENFLKPAGFLTREGSKALLLGYLVFAVHLGWIVAYYLLGEKLNFWCPSGVENIEVLSSTVPFYGAISLGLHASAQEETVARIVALALTWRVTGKFWLANLIQASIWAFMHSGYPQQPCYARGVELTVVGLFYGFILRRYGLLPCFIGHYLLDAFLDVKPLLSVGLNQPILFASAFIPLLPFILLWAGTRFFVPKAQEKKDELESTLSNSNIAVDATVPVQDDKEVEHYIYKGFEPARRNKVALLSALVLVITFFVKLPAPGDHAHLRINREQAIRQAQLVMKKAGININGYMSSPTLAANVALDELQYVFEKEKLQKTLELSAVTQPGYVWAVSFFRFDDPTAYRVQLRGDGSEYSLDIQEDDDAPGLNISEEEAQKVAEAYVRRVHPEYKEFKLSRSSWYERKSRKDYKIDFVVPSLKVGEAEYKFTLEVIGGRPCNFTQSWLIPDKWSFEREKKSERDVLFEHLRTGVSGLAIILGIFWLFKLLRAGLMSFRLPLIIALSCVALSLVEQINHLPSFFAYYETNMKEGVYLSNRLVSLANLLIGVFSKTFLQLIVAFGVFKMLKPNTSLSSILRTAFRPISVDDRISQKSMWIDGIVVALTWVALAQTNETIRYLLSYFLSPELHGAPIQALCSLPDYFSPVLSDLLELPRSFVVGVSTYLLFVGVFRFYCPTFWRFMLFSVLYDCISSTDERHLVDYFIAVLNGTINSVILYFMVVKLARFNPIVYLVKIVMDDCLPFVFAIYSCGLPTLMPDMVELLIYFCAPLLVVLYIKMRNKSISLSHLNSASDLGE